VEWAAIAISISLIARAIGPLHLLPALRQAKPARRCWRCKRPCSNDPDKDDGIPISWHIQHMAKASEMPMLLEEFLIWEEKQDEKYEYDNGVITMMTGARIRHDLARLNIASAFHAQLRGKLCRTHLDIKLVCPSGAVRYPDVSVDCGPLDRDASRQSEPSIVVEMLSPSTRSVDDIKKTSDYGSVPSIEVYLIVDPAEPSVDVFRRTSKGLEFVEQLTALDAVIELPSIGAKLALSDIYPPEAI
jgi:Uma2 family endonuclease